ncbi:tetratricopeptide repeat protein [Ignavibacteria bacterium 4148-Me]|uniref:tetratricopeptide repeat protein n=1 Tax=Rosettibacter primus TaxID=3111523 RepID=UPI00336BEDCA
MLGNYHFLTRDYPSAKEELENYLLLYPDNKRVKKKLIICYTQVNELEKAMDLFYSLVKEDIDFIINTNPETEDCPCPDLVKKIENEKPEYLSEYDLSLELGILWLYCNGEKSVQYFEKAYNLNAEDKRIPSVISKIKSRLK